jgi:hypothetical protein
MAKHPSFRSMVRLATMAALLGFTGCGEDRLSRLVPGSLAKVRGSDGGPVIAEFNARAERLAAGAVVRVISDTEGDPASPSRKVVVGIQEGPSQGLAALVNRSDLRPGR